MKTIVELKQVNKKIKGKKIINDLSFSVTSGEVFGFLGPNGAGKTTTIRMMVGLMKMSSGDVIIDGKSIADNFESAIQPVGAIVENPEFYKFLSGYQNLLQYSRMQKGITKEKIAEVVQLVGLTDSIHGKVKTYSLGMRQRLGLAQCLLHDPKVLILDEPTNGLDPAGIREIRDYIRNLAKERNIAVIVSSHLLSEMELMCDRIGIIQNGKLIDVKTVRDFVDGSEVVYRLDIDRAEEAKQWLNRDGVESGALIINGSLELKIAREDVPALVKDLVDYGFYLYGVQPVVKTLEDRFLEVTQKEAIVNG